jgi:glucose/arabinose dehydrogenase
VVRVTASGDKVVAGSEKLILRLGNQTSDHHMGEAIEFGKDGKLYIATGDNETSSNSQELTNLFGKMLRINKSGTIPTDSPFYTRASGNNRATWALGLRNPFKFAIEPTMDTTATNTIFINDVGEDAWEETDEGAAGANYGWNMYEGPEVSGPDLPLRPRRRPRNDGLLNHGGVFYPTIPQFPSGYVGDYFFADFCSGWIGSFDPSTGEASDFASGIVRPVDLEVSKNGELYYLSRGNSSTPGSVSKIRYSGGNP